MRCAHPDNKLSGLPDFYAQRPLRSAELAEGQAGGHGFGLFGVGLEGDFAAGAGGGVEGFHDFDDVEGEFAVEAVVALLGLLGKGEVGEAGAAAELVAMGERDGFPFALLGGPELDFAAEGVGVGDSEGAFGAVDFDEGHLGGPDVEAHGDGGDGAVGHFEFAAEMGGDFDFDLFAEVDFVGDDAFLEGDAGEGGDGLDRAHHDDEGGEVVGTHVEERAAALLIVEVGVGVPGLGAVTEHVGEGGDGFADGAGVDDLAGGLDAAAEDGVGRAADAEFAFLGFLEDLETFLVGEGEGFFAVDVLAGAEGGEVDADVGGGDGEVENGVDVGIGEEFLDGAGLEAVLDGLGAGEIHVEIGDGGEFRVGAVGREVLEVLAADVAAADDADAEGFGGGFGLGRHGGWSLGVDTCDPSVPS